MDLAGFSQVVPYLGHPLTLVGFVLFVAFGVLKTFLTHETFKWLSQRESARLAKLLVWIVFALALLLIVAGFTLQFIKEHPASRRVEQRGRQIDALADVAKRFCQEVRSGQGGDPVRDDSMRACATAIDALSRLDDEESPEKDRLEALARLERGDSMGAADIFANILAKRSAQAATAREGAVEAGLHLGALLNYTDPVRAVDAYRKILALDPKNITALERLGNISLRLGNMPDAIATFESLEREAGGDALKLARAHLSLSTAYLVGGDGVKALSFASKAATAAKAAGDSQLESMAAFNMGSVYASSGAIAYAERAFNRTLELSQAAGNNHGENLARASLANVYGSRGELARAEATYQQVIDHAETEGDVETTATAYYNMGRLYVAKGDDVNSERCLRKALTLGEASGYHRIVTTSAYSLAAMHKKNGDNAKADEYLARGKVAARRWRDAPQPPGRPLILLPGEAFSREAQPKGAAIPEVERTYMPRRPVS